MCSKNGFASGQKSSDFKSKLKTQVLWSYVQKLRIASILFINRIFVLWCFWNFTQNIYKLLRKSNFFSSVRVIAEVWNNSVSLTRKKKKRVREHEMYKIISFVSRIWFIHMYHMYITILCTEMKRQGKRQMLYYIAEVLWFFRFVGL